MSLVGSFLTMFVVSYLSFSFFLGLSHAVYTIYIYIFLVLGVYSTMCMLLGNP